MIPGEMEIAPGEIELNAGQPRTTLTVSNRGDRPIQVGSHYHFAETNSALAFDRAAALGQRLDIAAGTAVRFEPGQARTVTLVPYQGRRQVFGFRGLVMGALGAASDAAGNLTLAPDVAGTADLTRMPAGAPGTPASGRAGEPS